MTSHTRQNPDEAALAAAPKKLPHAPPFRLIDRVLGADFSAATLVAQHRLTASCGLWPAGDAVAGFFPDVLIIEALCQAAACFNILEAPPDAQRPHLGYLVSISGFRFHEDCAQPHFGRPRLGDTLILQVTRQSKMGNLIAFSAQARVRRDDSATHEVASGQLLFAIA